MQTRHFGAVLAGAAALGGVGTADAAPIASTTATTTYHRTQVDGVGIFYRQAGPKDAPTIVLLHGFPSSSREFDTLIPLLATHYHLIAPDFPGFGQSEAPPPSEYRYTFDHIAETMNDLLVQLKVGSYTLYIHDYGAPVGMRMILAHPDSAACPHQSERQHLPGGPRAEMAHDRAVLGRSEGAPGGHRQLRLL